MSQTGGNSGFIGGQASSGYFSNESLSTADVFQILKQRGFNIDSEKSILEPTPEFFHNVLVFCASLLLKVPLEEVTVSTQSELLFECEAESGVKAIQCVQKMRYLRQMLELVGIDDVGSYDLIRPEKKKVKRVLIAISHYIILKESIIRTHIDVLEKNKLEESKLKSLTEELEALRFESDKLKERKEAEKSIFKEKVQFLDKLTGEAAELQQQKAGETKERQETKQRKQGMERAIIQAEEDIKKMIDINEKEQNKIVKSPFKLKDQCQQLQLDITAKQTELQRIKQELQFLALKREIHDILIRKIKKNMTLPCFTVSEAIQKDSELAKNLKVIKNEAKELAIKEEQMNEQLSAAQQNHQELSIQYDQKQKAAEEKKKQYEMDRTQAQKEEHALQVNVNEISMTIAEIAAMKKNLEVNALDQEKQQEGFIRDKKAHMVELLKSIKNYEKNIFLMLDRPDYPSVQADNTRA